MKRMDGGRIAALGALVVLTACSDPQALPPLVVAEVVVAPADRVLALGDTMRLTGYPVTEDGVVLGSVELVWRSEDEAVATVVRRGPHAVVEARGVGSTRIHATADGVDGSVGVAVVAERLPVARVEIQPGGGELRLGGNQRLEAVLFAEDGSVLGGRTVQWTSSHGQRLTVTSFGNPALATLVAHAAGEAGITAVSEGRAASVTWRVIVAAAAH
jgi:hypothetical protein